MKLSEEEKDKQRKVKEWKHLKNVITSAFNFKKITTWSDVYAYEGLSSSTITSKGNASLPVKFPELRAYLESLNPEFTVVPLVQQPPAASTPTSSSSPTIPSAPSLTTPSIAPPSASTSVKEEAKEEPIVDDNEFNAANNYGLHESPNEPPKTKLFWFQKLAIARLWKSTIIHKHRGALLLAGTGTGKTFMVGGYLRRLLDIKYASGKSFGPTAYLYITRATVVEQTKRVFSKYFNIGIKDGVEVLNIEQLRSKAGEFWIDEKVVVIDGEEHISYTWRPMLHPVVMIVDECQSVKNEGSTQSKIVTSYSQLPVHDTICVFVSATPFTKVAEAKSFVINCHYEG
jgi:hypothetical protein